MLEAPLNSALASNPSNPSPLNCPALLTANLESEQKLKSVTVGMNKIALNQVIKRHQNVWRGEKERLIKWR